MRPVDVLSWSGSPIVAHSSAEGLSIYLAELHGQSVSEAWAGSTFSAFEA